MTQISQRNIVGTLFVTGKLLPQLNRFEGSNHPSNHRYEKIDSSSNLGTWDLTDVGNSAHEYTFELGFDHRTNGVLEGWGWVNHCPDANNTTTGGAINCDTHLSASDWLFTAEKIPDAAIQNVPEPGTTVLLGAGLLSLGWRRKTR